MDQICVFVLAAIILGMIGSQVLRKSFDPFEPIWLFLIGFAQIYVVQAISYRAYGLRVRGPEVVAAANIRALWALIWFLAVYYSGLGKKIARKLPSAPRYWSPNAILAISPFLILWGLFCSVATLRLSMGTTERGPGGEESLLLQFPMMLLVAGVLMIVTGRQTQKPMPALTAMGVSICVLYCLIWMFNSKRSHSMFAVLAGVCAFYLPRLRRPGVPTMAVTGALCAVVVSLAIGWRGTTKYETSASGFLQYVFDFNPAAVLVNLNMMERESVDEGYGELVSKETEEWGGFLLMMDTVPEKASYDYGDSYKRIFSTFIPRYLWLDKPYYGRPQWVAAWIAGSEFPRDETFTGPAIGILGATQLNGGAVATAIVLGILALATRTAYDYYRFYADSPWAQAWWAMTYFNAWLMNANDDPLVWFYYIYGFTTLPVMLGLWIYHKISSPSGFPSGS